MNKYGTASLVKTDLTVENLKMDTLGRALLFDIENITLGNLYLQSGTDGQSRSQREQYYSEILPQLLINCKD